MKRIALTDGSGRWFDEEAATCWNEATRFDGSNWVSVATGSQWDHEMLWRTAGSTWLRPTRRSPTSRRRRGW